MWGARKWRSALSDRDGIGARPPVRGADPHRGPGLVPGRARSQSEARARRLRRFEPGGVRRGLRRHRRLRAGRCRRVAQPAAGRRPAGFHPRRALGLPVVLENDVNAAVRAEATLGAAAGLRHVVMLTLGTGVGGGLWLDGRVYRGANGGAGELGHIIVRAGGLPCPCGSHGCLEVYTSGRALVRYAAARAGDPEADPSGELTALQEQGRLTGGAVTRLALAGDKAALDAVNELARWLGVGPGEPDECLRARDDRGGRRGRSAGRAAPVAGPGRGAEAGPSSGARQRPDRRCQAGEQGRPGGWGADRLADAGGDRSHQCRARASED